MNLPVNPWTVSPRLPWHPSAEEVGVGVGEQVADPVSAAGLGFSLLPGWMVMTVMVVVVMMTVMVRFLRELLRRIAVMMVLVEMCMEMEMLLLVLMQIVIDVVQLLIEAEDESGMGMRMVGACAVTRVRFGTVRFRVQRGGQGRQGAIFGRSTRLPCFCASAIQCSQIAVIKRRRQKETGRNLTGMRADTAGRAGFHQTWRHGRVHPRARGGMSSP